MPKRASYLVVERGFPYESGTTLPMKPSRTILGRKDSRWTPDIAFDNAFISRRQASVHVEDGIHYITDLGSKHGTAVNGTWLRPHVPSAIRPSDRIAFAKGLVLLTFSPLLPEETMDLTPMIASVRPAKELALDPLRQTVLFDGQACRLSAKEYRCLELLAGNPRRFIGKDEMVRAVWPERTVGGDFASVGAEEINSLLYRLRKKTNYALVIENIRGKGFMLRNGWS